MTELIDLDHSSSSNSNNGLSNPESLVFVYFGTGKAFNQANSAFIGYDEIGEPLVDCQLSSHLC